jgi:hypothetical protein
MNSKQGFYTNNSYATQRATAWYADNAKTGMFILTMHGKPMARVADGKIFLWDRDVKAEIEISLTHLQELSISR